MPIRRYRGQPWIDPRQYLRASPMQGVGSFARAPICQGEVVEVVGGVVMTKEEFRAFVRTTPRFNAIQIDEGLHLVERPEVTEERAGGSLNQSCDSHLWMADGATPIAHRDVAAGEELTVDYALFTVDPGWALDRPCRCGGPDCRREITGND